MTLRNFFNYLHQVGDENSKALWKYAEYETKFGTRREITFSVGAVVLSEAPATEDLSLLVVQCSDDQVYRHAHWLMATFVDYTLQGERTELPIIVYGQGAHIMSSVNTFDVELVSAEGTVVKADRFGNLREAVVKACRAVVVKRKKEQHS